MPFRVQSAMFNFRRILAVLIVAGAAAALVLWTPTYQALHVGQTMGTSFHIKWLTRSDATQVQKIQEGIDQRLELVNQKMSTYREDSELSQFNRSQSTDWFEVSPETQQVVAEALRLAVLSGGAFDPTVGPAVDLWGFGTQGDRIEPPAETQIAETLARIGFEKIAVRRAIPAIKKNEAGLELDLSAIAKGYAVDLVADYLVEHGVTDYMVEVGGEVRAGGVNLSGKPWRIAVERPADFGGAAGVQQVLPLSDLAMATSGTYRNYFDAEAKRYSHTINPVTGRPVEHDTISVTVFHESCMTADGLATALLVMGADEGVKLAEESDLAALFISGTEENLIEQTTSVFESRFGEME